MWRSFVLCTIWAALTTHQCLSPILVAPSHVILWKNCCASRREHPALQPVLGLGSTPEPKADTISMTSGAPEDFWSTPHREQRAGLCSWERGDEDWTHEGHSLGLEHPVLMTWWALVGARGHQGGPSFTEGTPFIGCWGLEPAQDAASLIQVLHCLFSGLAHCVFDHGDEIHSLRCNWRYAKWLSHSLSHSELVVGPQPWSPGQWPLTFSRHVASDVLLLLPHNIQCLFLFSSVMDWRSASPHCAYLKS